MNVSRPTIENGVVYAIAYEYPGVLPHVFAVRESDGKLLWRVPVPNYSSISSITVDASTVSLLTASGLYALDPATGAQRWHMANVSGVMRHGVIYVVTAISAYVPQTLMAVNARDGSIVWQVHEDVVFRPAVVNDRAIYGYGTQPFSIYAFDTQSGRQLTGVSRTAEGTPGSNSYAQGNLIAATDRFVLVDYLPSNVSRTQALSAVDGKVLWDVAVGFDDEAVPRAGVLVADDFIYGTYDNSIIAVRVSDGSVAWKTRYGSYDFPVGLSVTGGRVFVALAPQNPHMCSPHCASSVLSLDAATGTVKWQHDVDGAGPLAVPAQ